MKKLFFAVFAVLVGVASLSSDSKAVDASCNDVVGRQYICSYAYYTGSYGGGMTGMSCYNTYSKLSFTSSGAFSPYVFSGYNIGNSWYTASGQYMYSWGYVLNVYKKIYRYETDLCCQDWYYLKNKNNCEA